MTVIFNVTVVDGAILARLISGGLPIPNAERIMEKVM
jgi:hypothetical protein